MIKKLRPYIYLLYISILIIFDQISKNFFICYLKTKPFFIYKVTPFLNMVYVWNYGISFGIFNKYQQHSNIVFIIINSITICYLLYWIKSNTTKTYLFISTILITAGAISNVIDRVIKGAVFDFILLHYNNDIFFPVFNLADFMISLGIIIILYNVYIKKNLKNNKTHTRLGSNFKKKIRK